MLSSDLSAAGSSDPRSPAALAPPTAPRGSPERLSALAGRVAAAEATSFGRLPDRERVAALGDRVVGLLFPDGRRPPRSAVQVRAELDDLCPELGEVLRPLEDALPQTAADLCEPFLAELPEIHQRLELDAAAIEAGDPAARSVSEVVLAYPGFAALAFHRIAHAFHSLGVPLVPRLLAEIAHSRTGIDIHPGRRHRAFVLH